MKYTGYSLLAMGAVLVAYWVINSLVSQSGGRQPHSPFLASPERFDTVAILLVAVVTTVIGALLLTFGGRGYIQTNNPSVRN